MSIRAARESDIESILSIYAPYVTDTAYTFSYSVPEYEDFLCHFRAVTTQFPWLVWEENGLVLGYAHASAPFAKEAYQWCAEVTIYLHPEARGKGVGRALYQALESCLSRQGYRILYALITGSNQRSLDFHEKAGFRFLAEFPSCGFKHGHWHSVKWLEKRLDYVENPAMPPVSWPHLVKYYGNRT